MRARLYLSHRPDQDVLSGLEFGTPDDGHPPEGWEVVGEEVGLLRLDSEGPIVGFQAHGFSTLDTAHDDLSSLWDGPLFDVPVLALREAPVAAIIDAARLHFDGRPSLNRVHFDRAVSLHGEQAIPRWVACLEAGDPMAHFALGYRLFDLERYEEAYRHLRYYAEIASHHPWNWVWFGKAAETLGAIGEAREAYERAIELEEAGGDETDAPDLLRGLEATGRGE